MISEFLGVLARAPNRAGFMARERRRTGPGGLPLQDGSEKYTVISLFANSFYAVRNGRNSGDKIVIRGLKGSKGAEDEEDERAEEEKPGYGIPMTTAKEKGGRIAGAKKKERKEREGKEKREEGEVEEEEGEEQPSGKRR